MIDDLRHFKAQPDAFAIMEEGTAALALIGLIVFLILFWPYY